MEKGGREQGRLVGVRIVLQSFAIWSMLFLWIKIGSLLQISLSYCRLPLYDWIIVGWQGGRLLSWDFEASFGTSVVQETDLPGQLFSLPTDTIVHLNSTLWRI